MTTQKHKKILVVKNNTRKKYFGKYKFNNNIVNNHTVNNNTVNKHILHNSLNSIYISNDSDMNNEKRLSCFVANNIKINLFAFKTFYFLLNYWKTYYPKNWHSIIKHSLLEKIDKTTVLKIGFSLSEYNKIVQLINQRETSALFQYLSDKFHKVTASLNNLVEPEFTIYHVNIHKDLQKKFIKELQKLMLVKNIKWKDIYTIYNSLKTDEERNTYNFFIFDVIYSSDKSVDSIYRTNLGNMNFFRERLSTLKHDNTNLKKITDCNKSIISNNKDYLNYGIYNSTERYKINSTTPYAKIMKSMNEPFIGGPSGSTALMYIMLFHFYKYPFTYKNKILLLGTLIADYIPLWHTIPEILLSAYPEFKDKKIMKYTLDKNSVEYSIKLLSPFIL